MMHEEYKTRGWIIWGFLIFLSLCLLIKLFYIQVLKSNEFKKEAERIHTVKKVYTLPRGTIFDRNGNILAMSVESISIGANCRMISIKDYSKISRLLDINPGVFKKNKGFVWLKRRLPVDKIKKEKIPGIEYLVEHKRYYPQGEIGGNMIGFVRLEDDARRIEGLSGIEASFNKYLLSSSQNLTIIKDGKGRVLYYKERFPDELKGGDLYLSIDAKTQYIASSELKKTCEEYSASGGICIIGYPKTGEILALATYPSFDPNIYSSWHPEIWKKIPRKVLKNKAVSFVFEPGSLFKPIIAGILLQEGLVKENDRFFCNGEYKIGNKKIYCLHKHGAQTFKDVIKNSCNVGMSQAIERLSEDKLLFYLSQFGFGRKTNIGINEEETGIFPKKISPIRKANLSFGYGISVTPIQLYMAMSAICNNGLLLSPILVRSILQNNRIIKEYEPTPSALVLSKDVANKLKDMMTTVVEEGTGVLAKIEGYKIAGKTGTAEKSIGGRYDPSKIVSSFIGFLPSDNPEVLILVIIDEPKSAHYASIVAAPCFERIAERLIFLNKIMQSTEHRAQSTDNNK